MNESIMKKKINLTNAQLLDLRTYAIERELETIHFMNHILADQNEEGEPWLPGKGHQFHLAKRIVEFILTGQVEDSID